MEKINNYEEFDAKVDRYLRHQMTAEEEQTFKLEIALDDEKRERARITALMIKKMQQEGLKNDHKIIEELYGMNEALFRKTLNLKPRMLFLWSNIIRYSVAACIIGIISFGVYRYHEYNKTVTLGNSQYMAYVSDISEVGSSRGQESETIRKELVELFKNVEKGIEIKSTIEALELVYVESYAPNSPYNNFLDDISWNLAIAYLKNGEREKPILILENMIIRNTNYPEITQPVQKLIDQIKDL